VRVQSSDKEWRTGEWGRTTQRALALGGGTARIIDDGLLDEEQMLAGVGEGSRFVRVPVPGSEGLHLQGRPVLDLVASSDSPRTQLDAILCDVGPDGRCRIISRAFLNARYRDGLAKGKDLEPGKPYRFRLEFIDKDHVLAEDHRLELLISSSSSTWVVPDPQRATNTLHLDRSSLRLPVLR
jgi:hypothetical protein